MQQGHAREREGEEHELERHTRDLDAARGARVRGFHFRPRQSRADRCARAQRARRSRVAGAARTRIDRRRCRRRNPLQGRTSHAGSKNLRAAGASRSSPGTRCQSGIAPFEQVEETPGVEIVFDAALAGLVTHPHQRDLLRAARADVARDRAQVDEGARQHLACARRVDETLGPRVRRVNEHATAQIERRQLGRRVAGIEARQRPRVTLARQQGVRAAARAAPPLPPRPPRAAPARRRGRWHRPAWSRRGTRR